MSFQDINEPIAIHQDRVVRCRSCKARIVWLKTQSGANMPADADTVQVDDTLLVHMPYFIDLSFEQLDELHELRKAVKE